MNINENKQSSESQNAQIRAWLESGNTLTSLEALQLFGCMRLASRIHDLREKGVRIMAEKVQVASKKYVTKYQIEC